MGNCPLNNKVGPSFAFKGHAGVISTQLLGSNPKIFFLVIKQNQ